MFVCVCVCALLWFVFCCFVLVLLRASDSTIRSVLVRERMLVALIVIACGTCGSREKGSRDIWERTMKRRSHVCCCCCWKKQNFHCFLLLIRDYGFVCFCFCLPSFFLLFFTSSVPQNWKAIPNVWHKPYRNLISFLRPVLVAAAATTITAGTFSCRRWMSWF